MKDKNNGDNKIFYTQLSKSRRCEKAKDRPTNQLKNCRQYLDFMESYIIKAVKEFNKEVQDKERAKQQQVSQQEQQEGI